MQFTVFRTQRLLQPFDGDLTGKIIRNGSFVDKNTANKRAEALLPNPGPLVTRMELDYGEDGSARNGMFFGRVEYKDGTFVYMYVDCEYQQFGKIDPSEYEVKRMHPRYKQLYLAPRYDVFVFLRKPMSNQNGVVYEYEDGSRLKPVVDVIDDEDSDDEGSSIKGGEGDVVEVGSAARCDQDNSVDRNDDDRVGDATNESHDVGKDKHSTPQADREKSLGSHFQPKFEGSFTTVAQANAKAVDAFARWTQPEPPARMDAIIYYRDVLQPSIDELRRQFREDQDAREVTREAEIAWEPCPQFQYDYEAIYVVVVRSEIEGPLDLTGAFS